MLNLEQYYNTLANQGYDNIDYVIDIMWEDLEEIGIQKLGKALSVLQELAPLLYIYSFFKSGLQVIMRSIAFWQFLILVYY